MTLERDRTADPTGEEVLAYFDTLSNWGRWGEEDELGALNLITPAKRVAAAALVTEGTVVALGNDLDPDDGDPLGRGTELSLKPTTYEIGKMTSAREDVTMTTHGSPTHMDAPSHAGWAGRWYNGFGTNERTASGGPGRSSMVIARDGIVTRGVLLDIAGVRGVVWLGDGDGVYPADLEAAEEQQGVRVEEGDCLIVRTGYLQRARASAEPIDARFTTGYHASCLPWLHERGVAVISSDALNDISPSDYGSVESTNPEHVSQSDIDPGMPYPVHAVALVAMGAWMIDNVEVEELRQVCARLNRWAFLISMSPLRLVGASGSPVNPLAMF